MYTLLISKRISIKELKKDIKNEPAILLNNSFGLLYKYAHFCF